MTRLIKVAVVLAVTVGTMAQSEPLRVRRNFLGMHNLKGGGVTPFQTGMDWTKTLVGNGLIMDWVTDYDPNAPDHWIAEAIARGLVPTVRVQDCQYPCGPSAGYPGIVAEQIMQWKVAHPQYANRYVYMAIWNEPGDARDYVPMDEFADFMVAAYNNVRTVEANYANAYPELDMLGTLVVMTPGQNGGWDEAFNHNPQAKFAFDVWGTHPYPDMTPPWWNIHDSDFDSGANYLKCIDSYIQDLDEVAKTHNGVAGRRGFPVMITETNYGWFVGFSPEGWPKLTQEARAPYMVDAYFNRWYQWPEIIGVHPFLLNNVSWPGFEFVHNWTSQDIEAPFGVLEPAVPLPIYTAVKQARADHEAAGTLAPARLSPYRGAVGSIAGTVTRSDTGAPVPYATIYTDGYEFGHLTLYDGVYEVHNVPVGAYTLSVQKYGYRPASQQITVTANQTVVANFNVVFTGKTMEKLYFVNNTMGTCDGSCSNQWAVDHWQSFWTGPNTGFIKFASCHIAGDNYSVKFFITKDSPAGAQVGVPMYITNPATAGDSLIGYEWPDGQEPVVLPNTKYWLHFQRADGQPFYCYASMNNPYPSGESSSSTNVDFYGCIMGMTQAVNQVTGTVAGTVKDTSNNPLSGATVEIDPGANSTTSAADGTYTLANVAVGTYSVQASKAGYQTQTIANQVVTENTTTTVNFNLASLPPTINQSPTSLTASCNQGSSPANQTFEVANTGGGTLSYSISDNVTWLSCSPTSGTSTGEVDTITVNYSTASLTAGTYNATITISDPNATNNPQTIAVTVTINPSGTAVAEDFETMPSWSSSFDAAWGNAANWSIVAGGQAGNGLQAQRTAPGSSSKVKVYTISANTNYTLSVYIKCPSGSSYWAECAYRLGSYTAQDLDANAGSWTMIQKFASDGTNGNGGTWTQYSKGFSSASNTQISVGFKLGSSSGTGPTVQWDTLRVTQLASVPTIALSPTSLAPS
ncbi:MAG: carboxypeptidase regulatory-like domain-containing protein, partial [Phycisphaerae bacterium]|nr:carboxypeptidase regulatory-like domain-containing protein [Phycisphaerae bacterium]